MIRTMLADRPIKSNKFRRHSVLLIPAFKLITVADPVLVRTGGGSRLCNCQKSWSMERCPDRAASSKECSNVIRSLHDIIWARLRFITQQLPPFSKEFMRKSSGFTWRVSIFFWIPWWLQHTPSTYSQCLPSAHLSNRDHILPFPVLVLRAFILFPLFGPLTKSALA